MPALEVTKEEIINSPKSVRPHIVILGAGASIASFPEGDANGKLLPSMANFIEVLKLEDLLERHGIEWRGINFETIYSDLYNWNPESDILKNIEDIN